MAGEFDKKWLDGLSMNGSTEKQAKSESGRVTRKYTPYERPARIADVLSWSESGDTIVIVLKNGKKYRVTKNGKGKAGDGAAA